MAIITFWSPTNRETGQTYSIAATATYLSMEHNYKVLLCPTAFKDKTLEECFWNLDKNAELIKSITGSQKVNLDSGIDGLIKAVSSNKNSPEVIQNYTKLVFKDRLEVLFSSSTDEEPEYERIKNYYPEVLLTANRYYNLIFVDLNKDIEDPVTKKVLELSDIIVVNVIQNIKNIDYFVKLKEEEESLFKGKSLFLLLGRYDKFSKYNVKNITRYISEKKDIFTIPYNTLFFEASGEGKIADYFLKLRNLEPSDRNAVFVDEVKRLTEKILYKLQELQMKI